MKALSFLQPWAFAAIELGKEIDNRRRSDGRIPSVCRHRGPLLIHASGRPTQGYYLEAVAWIRQNIGADVADRIPPWFRCGRDERLRVGGFVGCCNVVGHVMPTGACRQRPYEDEARDGFLCEGPELPKVIDMRWQMEGSHGLIIVDRERVPFVPWKGQLGLFEVPDNYATRAA